MSIADSICYGHRRERQNDEGPLRRRQSGSNVMCQIRSKIKEDGQNTQHAAAQLIIQLQHAVPVDSMLGMKDEFQPY